MRAMRAMRSMQPTSTGDGFEQHADGASYSLPDIVPTYESRSDAEKQLARLDAQKYPRRS